ncbi:Sporulation-control protein spo0M [Streptomyces sp. S4.7]|uniref:sporulation protein n=1 Tax=Streptomyces sp. S4.7 TaxID=2705439 RepID=UPI0013981B81|nr:sporulation protein [Streptomyces sp. S4.7]QHY97049.1 Sporulation-control protein spo0M [Streptomyces sp. S4.7]
MVFKRLLGSLGVGGPTVETVLEAGAVLPGGTLRGEVRLVGGSESYDVDRVDLELVAHVEAEHEEGESKGYVGFERYEIGGGFRLGEGASHSVPFSVPVPWEIPFTELHGEPLGVSLGVVTDLELSGARDKGDFDALAVRPLAVQEAVLEAFGQLGFGFRSADLELGHINGTGQRLPFYQEIELIPAPSYAHRLNEVEVTFLAHPGGTEVVLEADGRGEAGVDDALNRHTVGHEEVPHTDWNAVVAGWMDRLASGYGDHAYGHGHGSDHGAGHGHGSGMSTGAAVALGAAGLAVGVAGGMVAAEVVDEVGDFFEEEEEEEGEEEGEEG